MTENERQLREWIRAVGGGPGSIALRDLEAALACTRAEALEEAAQVCDVRAAEGRGLGERIGPTFIEGDAKSIRALAGDTPPASIPVERVREVLVALRDHPTSSDCSTASEAARRLGVPLDGAGGVDTRVAHLLRAQQRASAPVEQYAWRQRPLHLLRRPEPGVTMTEREMVEEFHKAMGLPARTTPTMPTREEALLRGRLKWEEFQDWLEAAGLCIMAGGIHLVAGAVPDPARMAHENADMRVLSLGDDVQWGHPPEAFAEVMRANMSKLGDDGKPVLREDGKVMKGPNYRPPDVAGVLERAVSEQPCECGHHRGWHHLGKKRACVKKLDDGNMCPCKQWNPAEAP